VKRLAIVQAAIYSCDRRKQLPFHAYFCYILSMAQQIDAIYDNGVFRPLVPLSLPDNAHVKLTVEPKPIVEPTDKLSAQKEALRKFWQDLDKLPRMRNNDGWSVRQHDALLYGRSQ
jgi:predicted DNA-binding antitoxin AbrB/MazE fold protein